jgi:hypothetical protein
MSITAAVFGQTPYVELSISPETIEKGDQFTIEIRTNVPGKLSIDNLPPSFSLVQYSEGSSITTMNQNTGEMEMTFVSTYTGSISVAGEYAIGPAFITSSKGSYSSKKVNLSVEKEIELYADEITIKQLKQPAFGVIQTSKNKIYEGEPLITSAKVYSRYYGRIVDPESYTLQGALDHHPVGAKNRLSIGDELVQGIPLYTFVFDKQLIFPTGSGKVKIEPFKVKLVSSQVYEITSMYANVDIVPLPANPPKDFIGGVGDFSVQCSTGDTEIKQGEVFKLKVVVSGQGNLHNTTAPSLELPRGFTVYGDPVIKENYRFNSEGCKGRISYEYNVLVKTSGKKILPPVSVSYFDLNKESYATSYTKDTIEIKVERDPSYANTTVETSDEKREPELSAPPILTEQIIVSNDSIFNSPIYWGSMGIPVLSAFLFLLFKTRTTEKDEKEVVMQHKQNSLEELLTKIKTARNSGNTDEFFKLTDEALRAMFSIQIGREAMLITKKDMVSHLEVNGQSELIENLTSILTACESARYGMVGSNEDLVRIEANLKTIKEMLK